MSDEEMEKFQISDYDLDNEFNIHRHQRKMSKKQQMLGKILKSLNVILLGHTFQLQTLDSWY